jgi:hypothetical protein
MEDELDDNRSWWEAFMHSLRRCARVRIVRIHIHTRVRIASTFVLHIAYEACETPATTMTTPYILSCC